MQGTNCLLCVNIKVRSELYECITVNNVFLVLE